MPKYRKPGDEYKWESDKPLGRQTAQRGTCYNCGGIIWGTAYNKYSEREGRMVKVCISCKEVPV